MDTENRFDLARKSLELRKRAAWIVWGSQFYLLSIFIGGLYLISTAEQQKHLAEGFFHPPGWIVPTVAIALATAAVWATKKRVIDGRVLAELKSLSPGSVDYLEKIIQSSHIWSTWNIVVWVLTEAVSMVGVADAILSGNVWVAAPYLLISVALFLKERPRFDRWLESQGLVSFAGVASASSSSILPPQ
jgi:hypothetical protein